MFSGHPAWFFRDGKALFRNRFFHGKPLTELRPGHHINLCAFLASFGTAVIVPAFQRRIIFERVLGYDICYHIQFDVVMVPVFPFRAVAVIDMAENQYTVPVSDFGFLIGEAL